MLRIPALALLACTVLPAQQPPMPTQLPGSPFFIKQTWVIGGVGNWDYLTMDPAASRLYIAHGPVVQVVDVETGQLTGTVTGLREAHSVALDDTGEFGYVTDGPASQVKVFDRRTLAVVGTISTGPAPRALVFEPRNQLLFAVCAMSAPPAQPAAAQGGRAPNAPRPASGNAPPRSPASEEVKSSVTVIDAQTRQPLGEILMPGRLGFAETDSNGQVFINMVNRNWIVRLDAESIASLLGRRAGRAAAAQTTAPQPASTPPSPAPTNQAQAQPSPAPSTPPTAGSTSQVLDWSHESRLPNSAENRMNLLSVGPECRELSALAIDGPHERLFAACANMRLLVLNGATGEQVASLPIGPGPEAIGYDSGRGLIYSANGGAQGSLTIIRQDVTDSYAVIQNLPTRQRARTLAVNPATGNVYLVTDLLGFRLDRPGGIGTLQTPPLPGSFQVLVVGN
jgi:DNA-binding beta-propeller fold protein YncE